MTIFLLIRVFFVVIFASAPLQAQGGFFSFILGDDVYADTMITPVDPNQPNQTLGNMALLQANVSPDSILEDKTSKKDDVINPNASINIVSDNALLSATGPMGVFDGEDGVDPSYLDTSVYVVRPGDTIGQIAQMYGVSVNTILWANDMKKEDKLVPGDVLFILPIDGREHTVASGQTLQSIAKLYKADIKDIIEINNIAGDARLAVGDKLLIPGGNMADEGGDKPAPNLGSAVTRDKNYYATHPVQNLAGYFINPIPTGRKTQGLHGPGNRGIDIAAPTGTPIYASASGIVTVVKTGCVVGKKKCGGGYGNFVDIQHSNGTKTRYAHLSQVNTFIGAKVKQGDVIGRVGSTGNSTGPHIHFEVFNAKNPGADGSWTK